MFQVFYKNNQTTKIQISLNSISGSSRLNFLLPSLAPSYLATGQQLFRQMVEPREDQMTEIKTTGC